MSLQQCFKKFTEVFSGPALPYDFHTWDALHLQVTDIELSDEQCPPLYQDGAYRSLITTTAQATANAQAEHEEEVASMVPQFMRTGNVATDNQLYAEVYGSGAKRKRLSRAPQSKPPNVPVVHLYCRTMQGVSVLVNAYGFYPKIYIRLRHHISHADAGVLVAQYESRYRDNKQFFNNETAIISHRIIQAFPIDPYTKDPCWFLELTLSATSLITTLGNQCKQYHDVDVYECTPALMQYQVATGLHSFAWFDLPLKNSTTVANTTLSSTCSYVFDCHCSAMVPTPNDNSIAPMRLFTFDIECANSARNTGRTDPNFDPIILISCACTQYEDGRAVWTKRVLLQDGVSDNLPANNLTENDLHIRLPLRSEKGLLDLFGGLFDTFDADFVAGHNANVFDIPYVLKRAHKLGARCEFLARRSIGKWRPPYEMDGKGHVPRTRSDTQGRIVIDTLVWIRDFMGSKHDSYRLGNLAQRYLKVNKEDIGGYQMIKPLWLTSNSTRAKLALYCMKDTDLTLGLIEHKEWMMVLSCIEACKAMKAVATNILLSGQQNKLKTIIHMQARNPGFKDDAGIDYKLPALFPYENTVKSEKFPGAAVLNPLRGFYEDDDIFVLDFSSLYPSVMIAYNICFCTHVLDKRVVDAGITRRSPNNAHFIKQEHRVGIIPQLLSRFLRLRGEAKRAMKTPGIDENTLKLYFTRQLWLKISANSVYGMLTATGFLPRIELGHAVTSLGKEALMVAKEVAEKEEYGCEVIYGDTDSVMLRVRDRSRAPKTLQEGFAFMDRIGKDATATIDLEPITLLPEKIYRRYLLLEKKRYIALMYENPDKPPVIDQKGLELKRRDNCGLVKDFMNMVVKYALIDQNKHALQPAMREKATSVHRGDVSLDRLIISKSLSKHMVDPDDPQAAIKRKRDDHYSNDMMHTTLVRRMRKRFPSYIAEIGDRIPYVLVANGAKLMRDRSEDPLWAIDHSIPIAHSLYIENQVKTPVGKMLVWIYAKKEELQLLRAYQLDLREKEFSEDCDPAIVKAALSTFEKYRDEVQERLASEFLGTSYVENKVNPQETKNRNLLTSYFGVAKKQETPVAACSVDIEALDCQLRELNAVCTSCRGYEIDASKRCECQQRDCPNLWKLISVHAKRYHQ